MPVQTDSLQDLQKRRFDVTAFHEKVENLSLATGANTLSTTQTPAGKMRKITQIAFSYTGTVAGVRLEIQAGGQTVHKTSADPTSGKIETLQGVAIYLDATEKIDLVVSGATLNDDAMITIHGVEGIAEGIG